MEKMRHSMPLATPKGKTRDSHHQFYKLALGRRMRVCSTSLPAAQGDGRRCMHRSRTAVGVIVDVTCEQVDSFLVEISKERYFDAMHKWLFLDYAGYDRLDLEMTRILRQCQLSVDADITVAVYNESQLDLYDVFSHGTLQGGTLVVTDFGRWTQNEGLQVWLSEYKYKQRWNFHNLTLRAVTVEVIVDQSDHRIENFALTTTLWNDLSKNTGHAPMMSDRGRTFTPDVLVERSYTRGVAIITKVSSMAVNILKEQHNFRFNYTVVDRWVGSPERNTALAVTNSLFWKDQDISSTGIRILSAWLNWIDPIIPYTTYVETKFYYKIPTEGVGKLENEFIRPFSHGVWLCTVTAGLLCGLMLVIAARVETRPRSLQFAAFTVFGAFCQQLFEDGSSSPSTSSQVPPGQTGRKLTTLVTGLCSLLLYNYYTSSVVSWLLSAPPASIASLEELVASPLEVIFEEMGYTTSWLEVPGYYYSRQTVQEDALRAKKVKTSNRKLPLFHNVDQGIEYIKQGGCAYHTEPYQANFHISKMFSQEELCDLGSLQMMEPACVYVVLQRGSPYREFFSWRMMRVKESGHMDLINQRIGVPTPACLGSTPRPLNLGGAAPALIVLAVLGWGASLILLLVEIVMHRLY